MHDFGWSLSVGKQGNNRGVLRSPCARTQCPSSYGVDLVEILHHSLADDRTRESGGNVHVLSLTHLRIEIRQLYLSVRQFLSYPPDHLCCPELSLNLAERLDKPVLNTGGFANLARIGLPPQSFAELLFPLHLVNLLQSSQNLQGTLPDLKDMLRIFVVPEARAILELHVQGGHSCARYTSYRWNWPHYSF